MNSSSSIKILEYLKQRPFLLAPMAGVTNSPFRLFMREMGCGILTTELISALSLVYGNPRARDLYRFESVEHPIGAQLFGEESDPMAAGAKIMEGFGFDFIDINMGCPVNKVVKKGSGAALMRDPIRVAEIFRKMRKAISIPLTVKIRLGWDDSSRNADEIIKIAFNEGLTWVTVHGRTRSAGYSGSSDWEYMTQLVQAHRIPIIGNGDVAQGSQAIKYLARGFAGIMIGRAAVRDPWIFQRATELMDGNSINGTALCYQPLMEKLDLLYERNPNERYWIINMRKLAAWYSHGLDQSAHFRRELFKLKTKLEIKNYISQYYADKRSLADAAGEFFALSGHG